MKHGIRLIGAAILVVFYCFAIGFITSPPVRVSLETQAPTYEHKLTSASADLFCSRYQSESTIESINNLLSQSFKPPFNWRLVITKATAQLFKTRFGQYSNFSIIFLIQHRKTNIIFPFHIFW